MTWAEIRSPTREAAAAPASTAAWTRHQRRDGLFDPEYGHFCCLDHRVRGFDSCNETTGLDHTKCFVCVV
jgi:hypothetical protein